MVYVNKKPLHTIVTHHRGMETPSSCSTSNCVLCDRDTFSGVCQHCAMLAASPLAPSPQRSSVARPPRLLVGAPPVSDAVAVAVAVTPSSPFTAMLSGNRSSERERKRTRESECECGRGCGQVEIWGITYFQCDPLVSSLAAAAEEEMLASDQEEEASPNPSPVAKRTRKSKSVVPSTPPAAKPRERPPSVKFERFSREHGYPPVLHL